jgi:hypothetical protein
VDSALVAAPRDDVVLLGVDERSAAVWAGGEWRAAGPGGVTVIAAGNVGRVASGDPIEGLPTPT